MRKCSNCHEIKSGLDLKIVNLVDNDGYEVHLSLCDACLEEIREAFT